MFRRKRMTCAFAIAASAAVIGAALAPGAAMAADGADVLINEAYLKGGSAGAPYTNKFIELYNAGDTAQSLDGWSLQYRPAAQSGAASGVVPLSGTIEPDGYYLVALGSNGSNGQALPTPDLSSTAINPSGTTGTLYLADTAAPLTIATGSVVGAEGVVDLLGYGGSNTFEGAVAPVDGPNGTPNALARTDVVDTDVNAVDFANVTAVTPQASENAGQEPGPEEPTEPGEVIPIADIQGTTDTSPYAGRTVTTRGVVTASYPTGGFTGFTIQTEGTGGAIDLATHAASDAIFVYGQTAVAQVEIGDLVEVTAPVVEYNGLTELSAYAEDVTVLDEEFAAVQPAEVAWPETDAERESLESMLVAPQGDFTISDTYDTNYYASIGLASGTSPLITPSDVANPADVEAYDAVVADNAARKVTLDDGASVNFNSTANKGTELPYLSLEDPVRVGAPVTFTRPVIVDYRNGLWNFQPTQQLTVENADAVQPAVFENTRTAAPAEVGGDIRIASFNVLNYFTTTAADVGCTSVYRDRDGNPIAANRCPDNGPRGAADDINLERQEAKIVAAVNSLGADVVSLEEIENSSQFGADRDEALATLVDALNAADGSHGQWAFVPSPATVPTDEDVIRTAFIYREDAVVPVGESVILDADAFSNARQPLAQTFAPVDDADAAFLAIVNHFKSKGDSDPAATGDNANGPQGAFNGDRTRQAQALVDFADELKAAAGTDDVFLLGDFNAYTQEDPMRVFADAGYIDLGSTTGKHTYSFDGQSGSLDHILASAEAVDLVTGVDIWNINAGESIALEYSRYNYNAKLLYDASPYRSSDHDPVVVGLDLSESDGSEGESDAEADAGADAEASGGPDGSDADAGAGANGSDADGTGADADAGQDADADGSGAEADSESDASGGSDGQGADAGQDAGTGSGGAETEAHQDAGAGMDADAQQGADADASGPDAGAASNGGASDAEKGSNGSDTASSGADGPDEASADSSGPEHSAAEAEHDADADGSAPDDGGPDADAADAASDGAQADADADGPGGSADADGPGGSDGSADAGSAAEGDADGQPDSSDGKPSQTPTPSSDAEIAAVSGGIQIVAGDVVPGGRITVRIDGQADAWTALWMHSEPLLLGGDWLLADARAEVEVALPADASGTHRLVAQDADGTVVGVLEISFPSADKHLAPTGGEIAGFVLAAGTMALIAGAAILIVRRRRTA